MCVFVCALLVRWCAPYVGTILSRQTPTGRRAAGRYDTVVVMIQ